MWHGRQETWELTAHSRAPFPKRFRGYRKKRIEAISVEEEFIFSVLPTALYSALTKHT